jgi:hypothetical protein
MARVQFSPREKHMKTKRICSGAYKVVDGLNTVHVTRVEYPDGIYWIAAANWDRDLLTDPLPTKREAIFNAQHMLTEGRN